MVLLSITHHCLKTAVHLDEERGLVGHGEHPLLDHGALDVVVLDDDVLLQDLDGVQLVGALSLGQHDLRVKREGVGFPSVFPQGGVGWQIESPFRRSLSRAP